MNPRYMYILIGMFLLVTGIFVYNITAPAPEQVDLLHEDISTWKTYESTKLGFSFSYPEKYFLEEKELGDGHLGHLVLILTEDTEENRLVREGLAPGREGPVYISFDVYQSPSEQDPRAWVEANPLLSNINASDKQIVDATFGGRPAVLYHWSGLYEADNIVAFNGDYMISAVVTYIDPSDTIRDDFSNIVNTIIFSNPNEGAEESEGLTQNTVLITDVRIEGDNTIVVSDPVEWLWGEDAYQAAAEDTECTVKNADECVPSLYNNFYIRNIKTENEIHPLVADPEVFLQENAQSTKGTIGDIEEKLHKTWLPILAYIYVNNIGQVEKIEEIYMP